MHQRYPVTLFQNAATAPATMFIIHVYMCNLCLRQKKLEQTESLIGKNWKAATPFLSTVNTIHSFICIRKYSMQIIF